MILDPFPLFWQTLAGSCTAGLNFSFPYGTLYHQSQLYTCSTSNLNQLISNLNQRLEYTQFFNMSLTICELIGFSYYVLWTQCIIEDNLSYSFGVFSLSSICNRSIIGCHGVKFFAESAQTLSGMTSVNSFGLLRCVSRQSFSV